MCCYAAITGWGHETPRRVLTNHELASLVDTSDEWVRMRTGISERRIAGPEETTSSMCVRAARRALEQARLSPRDLDLIICATTTPDQLLPATACLVQQHLGADRAGAFDLNTACTGFVYALIVGTQFVQAGTYRRVLVTAGETLSRFLDWKDRDTCVLFGDGAGAVVLEATEERAGVLSMVLGSQGDLGEALTIRGGGSARPATAETLTAGEHFVAMRGSEIYRLAVRRMGQAARQALEQAGVAAAGLLQVIPHQANVRIIAATREALGLPPEKVFVNIDRYGNTGAASVAIALSEYLDQGLPDPGDDLLLVSFGGGLTWAAALLRWAHVLARTARRPLRDADCQLSVLSGKVRARSSPETTASAAT
jgi:3-oxoacyl-[acyl-carrier-protein] synthase-3